MNDLLLASRYTQSISTIHLCSSYYQGIVKENDREKAAVRDDSLFKNAVRPTKSDSDISISDKTVP